MALGQHDVVVVLGSGWAGAAPEGDTETMMSEIAGFPVPQVHGHAGVLRSCTVGRTRVLVAIGRVHLYEGHGPDAVAHTVRYAADHGCRIAVLTNAAGAMDPATPLGSVVVVSDQINMTGASPLVGSRFVDLTDLYSPRLRRAASEVEPALTEGVYVGTHGPEFETPAEIRAYRSLGADLVGMSTVLEAIAAREAGLEVFGLSLVTNLAAGVTPDPLTLGHIAAVGDAAAPHLRDLLARLLAALPSAQ